jgi:hypothetical protein
MALPQDGRLRSHYDVSQQWEGACWQPVAGYPSACRPAGNRQWRPR